MIAVVPMPDEPPCTSIDSPAFSAPRSNTLCQTVKKVSGIAAASIIDSPGGTGSACALVHEAVFGVAAADHQRHHLVADLPARDAGAERDDLAGEFETGNVGRALRRRIEALALHHVRPVDAGGRDLHQHFALAGLRHRDAVPGTSTSGPPGVRMPMAVMVEGTVIRTP